MRADEQRADVICPITAVTAGPNHHFFGYYDRCPWDRTGRFLIAMETGFQDRLPGPDDSATIGIIDRQDGDRFHPLTITYAWNFQQGAMAQWVPPDADRLIIFNDRRHDKLVSIMLDIWTGERHELPQPIYALSPDGQWALGVDFAWLSRVRPGYGYAVPVQVYQPDLDQHGIYRVDLKTGTSRLILSMAEILAFQPSVMMQGATHWIEHLLVNPDSSRFLFLHRFTTADHGTWTRLLTADPDGSSLCCLAEGMISHYCWRNPQEILAWTRHRSAKTLSVAHRMLNAPFLKILKNWLRRRHGDWVRQHVVGDRFLLFTDRAEKSRSIGVGLLNRDAHIGFSQDGRWLLGDTYPDKNHKQSLYLYDDEQEKLITLGRFFAPPELAGGCRCDLHARLSRDGSQVCIDSTHMGSRQMYVLDVSAVVG